MTKMFRTFEFFENSCLFPKRALRFAACRVSDFDIRILGKNGSPAAALRGRLDSRAVEQERREKDKRRKNG